MAAFPSPANRAQRRAQRRALRRSGTAVGLSMLATTSLLGAYVGNPRLGRSYASVPVQCGSDVTGSGDSGSNAASTALLNAAIDDFVNRVNSCDLITITGSFEVVDTLHLLGTSKDDLVDSTLTIQGNGHQITGGSTYRGLVGFVKGGITVNDLAMREFVWSDGDVTNFGGALYNYFDIAVSGATFASNSAPFGGGVASKGTISVSGSYLGDNHSLNNGGAVWAKAVTVTGSTFSGNSSDAGGAGGAIWAHEGAVSATNSYFVGNAARLGGAITSGDVSSTITVTGSTFAFNSALEHGGAIDAGYTTGLTATNSTFYGNSATYNGGAIRAQGGATISFSTIAANSASGDGGGLWWAYPYVSTVSNSILWNNTAANGSDAFGTCFKTECAELDADYTSLTSETSVVSLAADGTGNIFGDPGLGVLGDNGGFLVPGSPAFTIPTAIPTGASPVFQAADPVSTGFPATDQRGVGFPRVTGDPARADMGAVQSPVPALAPSPQTVVGVTGTAITPTAELVASGFAGTVTYTVDAPLPDGLVLDASTGVISGTPTVVASGSWTITGSDGSRSATAVVNVTVSSPPAPVVVSLAPSPQTIVGRAWTNITPSARMRATGFTGAVRYRLNRALPPGLVINSTTGVISGKPRVTASGTWTMTASDGASSATAVVIIRISPKPQVPTTPVVLPPVVRPPGCTVVVKRTVRTNAGQVARVRVSASGGVGRAGEGKPDFTVVRGPGGEVWVCVTGRRAVTVTVQLTAPATIGYQAYSMAKKYMVRKLR